MLLGLVEKQSNKYVIYTFLVTRHSRSIFRTCQTSMMDPFCENKQHHLVVNYFLKESSIEASALFTWPEVF